MGIWIVRLKGLPSHACMQVLSLLEGVLGERGGLARAHLAGVDWPSVGVVKGLANSLTILHQNGLAGNNSRVLEVRVRGSRLLHEHIDRTLVVLLHFGDQLFLSPLGALHSGAAGTLRWHSAASTYVDLISSLNHRYFDLFD